MLVIGKIVSVLDMLSQEDSIGAIDLAKRLEMPKTTVHRILKELTLQGLLEQDKDSKKYKIGWKVVLLASQCLQREQEYYYVPLIKPYLQLLSNETKETVFLTIIKQKKVVCIAKVDGTRNLRYYAQIGTELPINCSAPAKVLLAFQPQSTRINTIKGLELKKHTQNSICDREQLLKELEKTQLCGYGICDNEVEIGSKAVAVPVFDNTGKVFSSIALIGPNERITNDFDNILDSMKRISYKITQRLSGVRL